MQASPLLLLLRKLLKKLLRKLLRKPLRKLLSHRGETQCRSLHHRLCSTWRGGY